MRRLGTLAASLALLVACSSSDDEQAGGSSGDPDADAPDARTASAEGGDASTPFDAGGDAPADAATGPDFSGEATYYAADGTGACGFKATPNDLMVAAMNGKQYAKSWCGQCVLVTGPKGTVKVRIVDLCPGCKQGGLDLSKQAFAAISPLSAGRIKITWHVVAC